MKIQFVKSAVGHGYGYMTGAEVDCNKAWGKEMIELGLAIELDDSEGDLPVDFPGRRVLVENGFQSLQEVKRIATVDQLIEIKGIGKKLAEQIVEILNPAE